jgi:hypothetical protein
MLCCFPLFAKFVDKISIFLGNDSSPDLPVQVRTGIDDLVWHG